MEDGYIINSRIANKYAPTIVPTPSSFGPQFEDNSLAMYGTIVFDFNAASPFELSVCGTSIPPYDGRHLNCSSSEGTRVRVIEPDDGSGWAKIINDETGDSGLVPASYVKGDNAEDDDAPSTKSGSLMRPSVAHTLSDGRSSINRESFVDASDDLIHGSGTFGASMNLNFNLKG